MSITVSGNKKGIAKALMILLLCFFMLIGSAGIMAPANAQTSSKSPFSNVGYSSYTHNSRFDGRLIVNGVDTSDWQSKKCDWTKAKEAGVDYAIMRVTWSATAKGSLKTKNDSAFESNYKNAKAAGVMCGAYVFSQAKNAKEAVKEADFAVARLRALGIGPNDLELPVYMDYEFSGTRLTGRLYGITKAKATNAAAAFCNRIKAHGYTPGIYANLSFFKNQLDTSKFASDVDLWCAQYYKKCESAVNYSKWQYSSSAKIDGLLSWMGIKGKIDVNFWYVNRNVNASPLTTIKGRTVLSLADAAKPRFTIKNGSATLVEGVDYIVGGIRNNKKGNAYAYIKGIGSYGGYALVPITVTDSSSGEANANLNGICANYLTYANTEFSVCTEKIDDSVSYKKGGKYTVNTDLNIRKGASTAKAKVRRSSLSKKAKKATSSGVYAVLKPGTKVKCVKVSGDWIKVKVKVGSKWAKVYGGWICTQDGDEVYVE
ncbi:MAG: hypothetical protein IKE52_06685 [Mogibacterium sp.]|nr:hypothetical protein [Mogibacterium sp.]